MNPPARFTDLSNRINNPTPTYPRLAGWAGQVRYTPIPPTADLGLCETRYGYISRSNLFDTNPNSSLEQQRIEAERNWLEHTTQFRESLTRSLMRRKNWDQDQRRAAPKYTFF